MLRPILQKLEFDRLSTAEQFDCKLDPDFQRLIVGKECSAESTTKVDRTAFEICLGIITEKCTIRETSNVQEQISVPIFEDQESCRILRPVEQFYLNSKVPPSTIRAGFGVNLERILHLIILFWYALTACEASVWSNHSSYFGETHGETRREGTQIQRKIA